MKSTINRINIWIACFAILLNALAPPMAHALAAMHRQGAQGEICSSDGLRLQAPAQADFLVDGASSSPAKKRLGQMVDCGFCLHHAGTYALLQSSVIGLGIAKGHELRPFLFDYRQQAQRALPAAQARGPPDQDVVLI